MRGRAARTALVVAMMMLLGGCQEAKEMAGKIKEKVAGKTISNESLPEAPDESPAIAPVQEGTVALLIAPEGYEDNEYKITKDALMDAGFDVKVLSFFGGTARGALGGETNVDGLLEDYLDKMEQFVGVVLIGGPGAAFYHQEKKAHDLVTKAVEAKKLVGAICLAPYTLANAGVLKGREATAWTGGDFTPEKLGIQGALFRDESVVIDGGIVTANGPDAATEFAQALVSTLKGE